MVSDQVVLSQWGRHMATKDNIIYDVDSDTTRTHGTRDRVIKVPLLKPLINFSRSRGI